MCGKDGIQLARIAKIHFYTRYDEYRSNPLWNQYRYEDYKFCYEFFDKYMIKEGARLDEEPVLKTGGGKTFGGSSPSPSAKT